MSSSGNGLVVPFKNGLFSTFYSIQPLCHRIQVIIDRRFYRRKYDTAKTLEAFNTTLLNELDLNQLREHLLAIVQDTMQPEYVSL